MAEGKIYIATITGTATLPDGSEAHLQEGITRVREGHPLLEGRSSIFREIDVHYDVETARQAPEAETKPVPVKAEAAPEPARVEAKTVAAAPAPRPQRGPRKGA